MEKIMKFDSQTIRPELRFRGRVLRFLLPHFTERKFRMANGFMNLFLKGKWLGKKTQMEEVFLPRADGTNLRICICRTRGEKQKNATGLLWMHGGGYALGLPEQDFSFVDAFSGDGSCVVVSPDYRRSTKAPYPAALEDSYLALRWMKEHAEELGICEDQLFVGGDSAGGGLAAAISLYARDKGEVSIAFQMPLYPMLDDRMETESARENGAPVWNSKSNEVAWGLYLSGKESLDGPLEYAAPARAQNLAGLPPACTYIGTIEPFYDETVAYVNRLREQGIPVHFKEFEGCFHGFDIMCPRSDAGKEARAFLLETFQYAKEHYFSKQPQK